MIPSSRAKAPVRLEPRDPLHELIGIFLAIFRLRPEGVAAAVTGSRGFYISAAENSGSYQSFVNFEITPLGDSAGLGVKLFHAHLL